MGSINPPTTPSNSMPSATNPLTPTWSGYVSDTREALILFEGVLTGTIHRVVRRPHDRERVDLIQSGSVFIYEEQASGIKRWTDGVPWSPSRILNNFLIYRELDKPFPPGEKKRAVKKVKREDSDELPLGMDTPDGGLHSPQTPMTPQLPISPSIKGEPGDRDADRSLVGSLTDSYPFKEGGLVKKTMSVVIEGTHYHLVSYYTPEDVRAGRLIKPGEDARLQYTTPRMELMQRQNFRAPIDDGDESMPNSPYGTSNQYATSPGIYMQSHGYVPQPGYHPYQMPGQHQAEMYHEQLRHRSSVSAQSPSHVQYPQMQQTSQQMQMHSGQGQMQAPLPQMQQIRDSYAQYDPAQYQEQSARIYQQQVQQHHHQAQLQAQQQVRAQQQAQQQAQQAQQQAQQQARQQQQHLYGSSHHQQQMPHWPSNQ